MKIPFCLISFGNSTVYRLPVDKCDSGKIEDLKEDVRNYLDSRFPEMKALDYYSKMTVRHIDSDDAARYSSYPEFNEDAVRKIEETLDTEVRDHQSLEELNLNAPYAAVN